MNILVVDDDPIVLELLTELLGRQGFKHVATALSADAAIALMDAASEAFDCFLLDVDMPGTNGIDLCGKIRRYEGYEKTPILMIAVIRHKDAIYDAFAAGASDFIMKPFDVSEIKERLHFAKIIKDPAQARHLALMRATHKLSPDPSSSPVKPVTALHMPELGAANADRVAPKGIVKRSGWRRLFSNRIKRKA